jgi:penicillin-binding protein 2
MHREQDRHKQFSRRMVVLASGKLALITALVGRMYYLQVLESERYVTLAEENRINLRLLAPPRGRIVDRFGVPLAVNRQNYRVLLVSEDVGDIGATLRSLGSMIEIDDEDTRRILREVGRARSFVPVTVRENLDWGEVARIEVNTPDLPGINIDVGQSRYYLHGGDMAHLMGYVAAVSEEELGGDPLLELPGFRIGKAGVEKVHDIALRGTGGSSQVEVNAYGRVIRELSRQEGQLGAEVRLTIDVGLQKYVARRLGDESATVVVMDVHTGEVLAMTSVPSYDPNAFNQGITPEYWKELINNEKSPLINKAISGQYSPGSTFKMVVALAALEKGAISPDTQFFCPGFVKLGKSKFHCWKKGGHGRLDLLGAITQSCDVYFYETAKRTGIDRIAAMANRMGLGLKLDIDLPNEHKGLMPTRKWKKAATGEPWQKGETLVVGIGQGYVSVTPLQLAVMTARLANGGFKVMPRLTREVVDGRNAQSLEPLEPFESLGLVPEHLAVVIQGMIDVVNGKRGTARRSKIKEKSMEMAGKTGTVQVKRITKADRESGAYKNKDIPWKDRDHALFVGFAPLHAPRYAVAVVVEHGGGGSKVAAPIARDVLLEAQRRDSARPGLGGTFRTAESAAPAANSLPGIGSAAADTVGGRKTP